MTIDIAVVGAPFLDISFEGLARVPREGEELAGRAVAMGPGGTGMQAIGAARLGLATALVAPIGRRGAAALVRTALEDEGVHLVGDDDAEIPVTALLATPEGVAMATGPAGSEPTVAEVASASARAVILSLGRLHLAPESGWVYTVTGGLELDGIDDGTLRKLAPARALILNATEAGKLTGVEDVEAAGRALAEYASVVVVTLGRAGALALEDGEIVRAEAPEVEVRDATGAGDLFVAAYVWADLGHAPLVDRLAWACLYAGLSVTAPTAFAGAVELDRLLAEGRERGLTAPPELR